jgi:hypothetical protein
MDFRGFINCKERTNKVFEKIFCMEQDQSGIESVTWRLFHFASLLLVEETEFVVGLNKKAFIFKSSWIGRGLIVEFNYFSRRCFGSYQDLIKT